MVSNVARCLSVCLLLTPMHALADEPAAGLLKDKQVSTGKEDVATTGFEAAAKRDATVTDATELKLSAGGLLSAGNARSMTGSVLGRFRLRRSHDQLSAALAGNYGQAAPSADVALQTTVQNLQGKVRYDRFLSRKVAVFAAVSGLNDRFQGLDLRANFDPGGAFYLIDEAKQQCWAELGYDLQYDLRRQANIDAAAAKGTTLARSDWRHSARAFIGYVNTVTKAATLDTGLEYLQALTDASYWRLTGNVAVASNLAGQFSVAAAVNVRYDHHPLPAVRTTDTLVTLSLVYQLL